MLTIHHYRGFKSVLMCGALLCAPFDILVVFHAKLDSNRLCSTLLQTMLLYETLHVVIEND